MIRNIETVLPNAILIKYLLPQVPECRGRERALRDPEDRVHEGRLPTSRRVLGGGDRTGSAQRQARPSRGEALSGYGICSVVGVVEALT